jgi:uncharacterized protein
MEKIRLGKTNLMVTKLGFGGIPIQRLSDAEAIAVVKKCVELGITFFDTANGYSTSEERIGQAIKDQRQNIYIATKSGARTREEMEKHLALSLQRLGTDYIDLYQCHGISDYKSLDKIQEPGGVIDFMKESRRKGLIKHIGITSHQIDVAKKAVQTDLFETLMFPFNFITSEAADELIPLCRKHDVGFIVMKPLAGGMVDQVKIAFKYLLQFPEVVAIPGIEKICEIEEIAQIYQKPAKLTLTEKKEMKKIKEALGSQFCHRCDYCQPCTTGIPISMVMTLKSLHKRLPTERFFSPMIMPAMEKAAQCSECGECEKRCPYRLAIRDMIKEQVEWYQGIRKQFEQEQACK